MEDGTGKGEEGVKTREDLTEMQETAVHASSVQEGVMDPGIDNPAFSDDTEGGIKDGDKIQNNNQALEEAIHVVEAKWSERADDAEPGEIFTTEAKSPQESEALAEKTSIDEDAKRTQHETPIAIPATMEVTTVQMDTRTKVVSTHKEDRVNVTAKSSTGPDSLAPADSLWVTDYDGAVKLRMSKEGAGAGTPRTMPSALIDTARKAGNHVALATKINNNWVKWTYLEYLQDVRAVAKSFIKLGLEPAHGVGIIGFNSPEWFFSLLGAMFAGGKGVGIYPTNSAEAVKYVLEDSRINVVVVEDDVQLQKVLRVRDDLPELKAVVQYKGSPKERYENVYTWTELMEMGKSISDDDLEARIRLCAPNKCCSIIYTSGTTGNPKGVMLSHDNVTWTARVTATTCKFRWQKEVAISYLPLSHIAAQLSDIYLCIETATTVYFAQPDALKGSLGVTIKEVRPTRFFGVPRVWEKMSEKLRSVGKQTTGCKKKISTWAKGVGLKGNLAAMNGQRKPLSFGIANALVFKKVKKVMGFDRCVSFYSGAAPISMDIVQYFLSLNIPILELYGMSETTGPHHIGVDDNFRIGTVGPVMVGVKTVLKDKDADGNGEICFWGRHLFMGYLNNEEKTQEAIDDEGLLHSGDVGKWDEKEVHLSITGRIKELLITAGGENVAPVPIEENVKSELPVVSNCMLIGDKRKFLSLLITLKTEVDLDTMIPGDKLTSEALEWVASVGSHCTTVAQILDSTDVRIMRAIQKGIEQANKKAPSRAQNIQKWTVLPVDFSLPGGELTPTLKLKRPVVLKHYAKTIEAFYKGT